MPARGGPADHYRRAGALGSAIVHDHGRVSVLVSPSRSDRHGPESAFGIRRNQRSTSSEYGPSVGNPNKQRIHGREDQAVKALWHPCLAPFTTLFPRGRVPTLTFSAASTGNIFSNR